MQEHQDNNQADTAADHEKSQSNSSWKSWNSFFGSRPLQIILYSILAVIVLLLTFRTGMIFGYQKALFSFHSGENYDEIFLGTNPPLPSMMQGGFFHDNFSNDHGMIGSILEINGNTMVLKDQNHGQSEEKSILVDDDTLIKRFQDTVATSDLKVGDTVIVIGDPNDSGQINAELIRYVPPPTSSPPSSDGATSSISNVSGVSSAGGGY